MKVLCLSLFSLFLLAPIAQAKETSWESIKQDLQARQSWHAEYRQGRNTIIVDNVKNKAQRVRGYRSGKPVFNRYLVFGQNGEVKESFQRYYGLDRCYRKINGGIAWNPMRDPFQLAQTSIEKITPSPLEWSWKHADNSKRWYLRSYRNPNGRQAFVRIRGNVSQDGSEGMVREVYARLRLSEGRYSRATTQFSGKVRVDVTPPQNSLCS